MTLNPTFITIAKLGAMLGLIICSTLVISLNFKAFKRIFKERTASMWWLFLGISVIPFVVMIGIFTVLFEQKSETTRVIAFKDGKVVVDITQSEFAQVTFIKPQEAVKNLVNEWK